jgi:thiol-disulfide isomerase/thioredoxin
MLIVPALILITTSCSAKDILNAKTQADINNAIKNNKMVLVDYHAESYCAPCKQMAKILPGIAKNFTEVLFVKADINNEGIGQDILSVPTFVFFLDGKEVKRFTGSKSEAAFTNDLNNAFKCCDKKK